MEVANIIIRQRYKPPEYGENNPEPLEFKDSAVVRNNSPDSLQAAFEYINGEIEQENKP